MDFTTKFDKRIDILGKTLVKPAKIVDAAVYANDTLEMAQMIAENIGASDGATILAIYDRIDRERLRLEALDEATR